MKKKIIYFMSLFTEPSIRLKKSFSTLNGNNWTIHTYYAELCIQLGHFVYLNNKELNVRELVREKFRNLDNIGDEICDILLQIFYLLDEHDMQINETLECTVILNNQEFDNISDILTVHITQLGDAILRYDTSKPDMGRNKEEEKEMILHHFYNIVYLLFTFAERNEIDLFAEYDAMIKDANHYINNLYHYADSKHGVIKQKTNEIIKRISLLNLNKLGIDICSDCMVDDINLYINRLESILQYISIAPVLSVKSIGDELEFVQEYIKGERLDNFLKCQVNYESNQDRIVNLLTNIIEEILHLYKEDKNIRIDCNICNFIVDKTDSDGKYSILLVDLYPPIFVNKFIKKDENNYPLLFSLYTDLRYQLISLIYYYIKALVSDKDISKSEAASICQLVNKTIGMIQHELTSYGIVDLTDCNRNIFIDQLNFIMDELEEVAAGKKQRIAINHWSIRERLGIKDGITRI